MLGFFAGNNNLQRHIAMENMNTVGPGRGLVNGKVDCPRCGGTGRKDATEDGPRLHTWSFNWFGVKKCSRCFGKGKVQAQSDAHGNILQYTKHDGYGGVVGGQLSEQGQIWPYKAGAK